MRTLDASFGKDWRSMVRHYSGTDDGEGEHAHFVLRKLVALLRTYRELEPRTGTGVPCPYRLADGEWRGSVDRAH